MTLALLITAASGAWATSDISRALLSVPNSWEKDQAVFLTAEELPGFKAVTEEEAANWVPTAEDIENGAFLIYGFDAEGNMLSYATLMGAPAIKVDPGKMPHNNMYGLSHGSMLQVRFYYTSDVTLVGDKTEATFAMPTYDATVDYELVRDMSVQMTTKVGDGADGADYRIRLKYENNAWELADMTVPQLMALISVHDAIEDKDLTYYSETGPVDCTVKIFAIDDNDQLAAQPTDYADLEPGRYVAIAVAEDGSNYIGETAQSNVIVLYQGYEVTIHAGEYITYYRDEPLKLDDNETNAELYTISAVGTETATLSGPYDAMKALTPMLVHNKNTEEAKTILLIPCNEPDLALTVAPEFKGTLEATEIAASSATSNNYAFNGKKFVWVMNDLEIGANKAWLSISATSGARVINLVFDDATRIDGVARTAEQSGDYYDLNGRKLAAKPTRKGVYIQNGKKVVVK